jgi:hypothetical protein
LIPHPTAGDHAWRHVVFAMEPCESIAGFVAGWVDRLAPSQVSLIASSSPFAAAIAASRGQEPSDESQWLREIEGSIAPHCPEVAAWTVHSNTGIGVCEAIEGLRADGMVVRVRDRGGFSRHLDWLRQVIPTRLLIARA